MSEIIESPKKTNGVFITIILALLIALGIMAFMWSKKNSKLNECNNHSTELQTEIAGMNEMMSGYVGNMSNDLQKDFQKMLDTYDNMKVSNKEQADSIALQKSKIEGLISELKSNKRISARELFKMRKENETLRSIMKSYIVQIDSLNTANLKLHSDLDETSNQLTSTKTERDQYKQEAEVSAERVKVGSKLQAFSFSSTGLRMKLNNTTEETNKAKNCIQIKSSFTLSENPLTASGNKTIYMQIIDPEGKTLQSRASNTLQTEQGSVAYSDKKDIDYQNQRYDISIYYDLKNKDAAKGNYKVKIYCEGYLIGTDNFTLK